MLGSFKGLLTFPSTDQNAILFYRVSFEDDFDTDMELIAASSVSHTSMTFIFCHV